MAGEIERDNHKLAEANNKKKQELHDSVGEGSEDLPEPELLKNLPPEARKVIEIGAMSMQRLGPVPNPLADKITEQHVDKILEIAAKDDERSFKGHLEKYSFRKFGA